MAYNFRHDFINRSLVPVLPSNSTAPDGAASSDLGKLITDSSGRANFIINTTQNSTALNGLVGGVVAAVPTRSTAGSTTPFYIRPVYQGEILEVDYSTTLATSTNFLAVSSNIGYYFGPPVTSDNGTAANGAVIDPSTATKAVGACRFLQMTGFDTDRRKIFGIIATSHLIA